MDVKSIEVRGLYGIFNYKIALNSNCPITIIHAPNGYGKTTLLRLISAVLGGNELYLVRTPFENFRLTFDDGSFLEVAKGPVDTDLRLRTEIHYSYHREGEDEKHYYPKSVEEQVKELPPLGSKEKGWKDPVTGKDLDMEEVLGIFKWLSPKGAPDWLLDIRAECPQLFIDSQRLTTLDGPEKGVPAVRVYSEELRELIESALAESVALSQELDRTYPTRLIAQLSSPSEENMSQEVLVAEIKELEERRRRLRRVGLLDPGEPIALDSGVMDPQTLQALSLYISDVKAKLEIFNELEQKINLLKEIINKLFKFKRMWISKESGITFIMDTDENLEPEKLASGEQHELVLHYKLLFKTMPGSLILIDEPEISLHIIWQEELLGDLLEIAKLTGVRILMATHSPQIISDRWDLTVELAGEDN